MGLFRFIRTIRFVGILNFILVLLAIWGLMSCIFSIVGLRDIYTSTTSNSADSGKEAISFETLRERQLHEGNIVEGKILFNMGDFTDSEDEKKYTHYGILLDDKVMSIAIHNAKDNKELKKQAKNYTTYLAQEGLSVWQYHDENNNSKKKNKKTVKQVIQENMENEPGVDFKGKVIKMNATIKSALRNYVTPEGETEPVFEIIPYEIKIIKPANHLIENILGYMIIALEGIIGIGALIIFILRIRAHKFGP